MPDTRTTLEGAFKVLAESCADELRDGLERYGYERSAAIFRPRVDGLRAEVESWPHDRLWFGDKWHCAPDCRRCRAMAWIGSQA